MTPLEQLGWNNHFQRQWSAAPPIPTEAPGRIIAVYKNAYVLSDGAQDYPAVCSGKLLHTPPPQGLPVVGDWVVVKKEAAGTGLILRVFDRLSELRRRKPMDRQSLKLSLESQVMAANLDWIFIVMSLNRDFNLARLERALTLVWNSGATPVILLSKADLCPDYPAKLAQASEIAIGVDVHAISSLETMGLDVVAAYFTPGRTGCLIGSSGVGKSTLVNALCQTDLATLSIRTDDDKGRHATTTRRLFKLPQGGMLIDTPGLREFGLTGENEGLSLSFEDVTALADHCRFTDCTHTTEPGCAVLAAVDQGILNADRLDHFHQLKKESLYQQGKQDPAMMQKLKQEQKQLGRTIKSFNKLREKRYE